MELVAHQDLLHGQNNRCNHCKYEFQDELFRYSVEDDGVASDKYIALPGEVVNFPVYRRPELDHIVPVILGGDGEQNWQILCASCNRGKSDLLTYFGGFHQSGAGRMTDLFEMTSGKRFAIIAESPHPTPPERGDGKFHRIFKLDSHGFLNRENLIARYA